MIDMYEHNDNNVQSDNGTEIDSGVKYLHVQNRPKFCTVPDIVRMINDMMNGQYVFGKVSLEKAIEEVKGYGGTETNINKALKLI